MNEHVQAGGGRWAILMLSLAVPVILLMVWSARTPSSAHGATEAVVGGAATLEDLMADVVSPRFAELMAAEKSGADPASLNPQFAELTSAFADADRLIPTVWTTDDFVEFRRLQADAVAVVSSWEQDEARDITSALDRLNQTCTACHARFAPHLVH